MTFLETPAARFISALEDWYTKHERFGIESSSLEQRGDMLVVMTPMRAKNVKAAEIAFQYIGKLADLLKVTIEIPTIVSRKYLPYYTAVGFSVVEGKMVRQPS